MSQQQPQGANYQSGDEVIWTNPDAGNSRYSASIVGSFREGQTVLYKIHTAEMQNGKREFTVPQGQLEAAGQRR